MPRSTALILLPIYLAGCTYSAPATLTTSKSLAQFQDANFGVRFNHSDAISTNYNPHGGADRVFISFKAKPIGGLLIRPLPPTTNIDAFIEAGKDYYRSKHSATSVEYDPYLTPRQYKFHRIRAEILSKASTYIIERYVYLRDSKPLPLDEGKAIIKSISGSFSFEFIYLKTDTEILTKEIKTIIDTFNINMLP